MNKKKPIKQFNKPSKTRQIVIETDGTNINIVKADVAGNLELVAILQSILRSILQQKLT